jgi:hypothetical protein
MQCRDIFGAMYTTQWQVARAATSNWYLLPEEAPSFHLQDVLSSHHVVQLHAVIYTYAYAYISPVWWLRRKTRPDGKKKLVSKYVAIIPASSTCLIRLRNVGQWHLVKLFTRTEYVFCLALCLVYLYLLQPASMTETCLIPWSKALVVNLKHIVLASEEFPCLLSNSKVYCNVFWSLSWARWI